MKKTLLCLATLLCGFAFLSCSGDDDEGAAASSPEKLLPSSIPVKEVDLDSVTSYELENTVHKVIFDVTAASDEKWTASLQFDENDPLKDSDGNVIEGESYELGYLGYGSESGTGNGKIALYVTDNLINEAHSATLTVNYDGKTPTKTITLTQVPSSENDGEKKEADTARQLVGYGYNPRKGNFSEKCRVKEIFKTAELTDGLKYVYDEEHPDDYDLVRIDRIDDKSEVSYREAAGTSISELESNYEATLTSNGEWCGFSEEIDSKASFEHKGKDNYQYAWTEILVDNYTAVLSADSHLMTQKGILTNQAYRAINGIVSPYESNNDGFKKLIKDYGMYVCVKAQLGGKAIIKMEANTSELKDAFDCHAMIKAGYSGFIDVSASVDITYKDTLTKNSSAFNFSSDIVGGTKEASTDLAKSIMTGFAEEGTPGKEEYKTWFATLADEKNCNFINLPDEDSLVPLYELVDVGREGGKARRDAMRLYYLTDMNKDFEKMDASRWESGIPSKIDLTKLSFSQDGTLVKELYLPDGKSGKRVAVACSEYIPEINSSERVTVIYPATNNEVFWNRGLYAGNAYCEPTSIAWRTDYANPVRYPPSESEDEKDKEDGPALILPEYTTVYLRGVTLSVIEPDWLTDEKKEKMAECVAKDYQFNFGANGTYDVVKVGKALFARDFYNGRYWNNGTETYIHGANQQLYYNYGDVSGHGANLNGGFFPEGGYGLPHCRPMRALVSRFAKSINTDRSLVGMFSENGLIGLRIFSSDSPKGYWYYIDKSFWESNHRWTWPFTTVSLHVTEAGWYPADTQKALFMCVDEEPHGAVLDSNPFVETVLRKTRFYISNTSVGIERDGIIEMQDGWLGPYFNVVICKYLD